VPGSLANFVCVITESNLTAVLWYPCPLRAAAGSLLACQSMSADFSELGGQHRRVALAANYVAGQLPQITLQAPCHTCSYHRGCIIKTHDHQEFSIDSQYGFATGLRQYNFCCSSARGQRPVITHRICTHMPGECRLARPVLHTDAGLHLALWRSTSLAVCWALHNLSRHTMACRARSALCEAQLCATPGGLTVANFGVMWA
jgi:hypothetical protein